MLTLVRKRLGLFLIGVLVGAGMFLIGGVGSDPGAQLGWADGEAGAVAPAHPVSVPCCAMHLSAAALGDTMHLAAAQSGTGVPRRGPSEGAPR